MACAAVLTMLLPYPLSPLVDYCFLFSSSVAAVLPLAPVPCHVLAQPPLLLLATASLLRLAVAITAVDCCYFIFFIVTCGSC